MPRLPSVLLRSSIAAGAGILIAAHALADSEPAAPAMPPTPPYPTEAVADYVIGCMLANGVSHETLRKCSCSFDQVAAAVPFDEYEKVKTLMSLQQAKGGGRTDVFKGSNWAKSAVERFKEVQAESTLRCF